MAFTARTETYFDADSLSSPYDAAVDKPSGTSEGDILFCLIGIRYETVDSVPSGWNLLASNTGNSDKYYLYYKIAGASEPSSYTWSFTGSDQIRMVCSCYTSGDFDASDPIDVVSSTEYRSYNDTLRAASMSVTADNSPLVFLGGVYNASTSVTFTKPSAPTSDWVEDDDAGSSGSDFWMTVCSMIWTGSGATGDMDAGMSGSTLAKHAFAVALNPTSAAHYERSGTALLGLLATSSKTCAYSRSSTALLGLVGAGTKAAHYVRAQTALLGLKTTASKAMALTRSKTALFGLVATGSKKIALTRTGTALLGLNATGIMSTAQHYIRTGIAYLGLVATGTNSISLSRTGTAMLGLKTTATKKIAIIRSGTALLGVKVTGFWTGLGRQLVIKVVTLQHRKIKVQTAQPRLLAVLTSQYRKIRTLLLGE